MIENGGPFKLQVVGDDGTWLDAANDEGVMRFASAADARIEGRWSFATNIVNDTGNPLRDWRVACVVESAAHRFEPGNIHATNTIAAAWAEEPALRATIRQCIVRHCRGDWGDDLPGEDWDANELALQSGARILSRYSTPWGDVYVVTEADRASTTALFCDEY